jgi:hypothetical protein
VDPVKEPEKRRPEMLPNFLIIGAMKAGTTSLHSYLTTHPEIYMSIKKEPNYFSSEKNWSKGVEWYESFFVLFFIDKI